MKLLTDSAETTLLGKLFHIQTARLVKKFLRNTYLHLTGSKLYILPFVSMSETTDDRKFNLGQQ